MAENITFLLTANASENAALFSCLVELSRRGLPFAYNPKEMSSPDALMMKWQESGKFTESFRLISWRDEKTWSITLITPPVVGVRSWIRPA